MAKWRLKPAEIGEAASLSISIAIMVALVGYLSYAALRPQTEQLAVSSRVGAIVEAGANSGQYVVPVDIHNDGTRGISALHLDITVAGQHHMVELQYIAAGAQHRIYVYSPGNGQPEVTVRPLSYNLD